jgi:hypothetical protein
MQLIQGCILSFLNIIITREEKLRRLNDMVLNLPYLFNCQFTCNPSESRLACGKFSGAQIEYHGTTKLDLFRIHHSYFCCFATVSATIPVAPSRFVFGTRNGLLGGFADNATYVVAYSRYNMRQRCGWLPISVLAG